MAKWIIAVCNLKGGVGKSTIALSIAGCLHRAGHGVVLVDADVRQRTLLRWAERAETTGAEDGAPVISLSGKSFRRDLDRVTKDYDVAVVDSAAGFAAEARSAALVADLVVVPVIPGAADMWALQGTLDVVEDVRAMRPELKVVVVPNRQDRTHLSRVTWQALDDLGNDISILPSGFGNRVAFGEAILAGQTVVDYAPRARAAREAKAVTTAILEKLGGRPSRAKRRRQ